MKTSPLHPHTNDLDSPRKRSVSPWLSAAIGAVLLSGFSCWRTYSFYLGTAPVPSAERFDMAPASLAQASCIFSLFVTVPLGGLLGFLLHLGIRKARSVFSRNP